MSAVNDANLGRTAYSYDAVGNLLGFTTPNGVTTYHSYDALNRLTNVTGSKVLNPLANYTYTLAANGQRTAVAELNGRVVNYAYDLLNRLTNETVTGAANYGTATYNYDATYRLLNESLAVAGPVSLPASANVGYTLDDVGNRLNRTSTLPGVDGQSLAYDANDRLTTDTYDANGNTVSGSAPAPGAVVGASPTTLGGSYDFEDRLVTATASGGATITIIYDGDGHRVAKTAGGVTTLFLVDDRNPTGYAQVLEELTLVSGTPVLSRVYAYGHDLISQDQLLDDGAGGFAWSASFYGYDGHGNVRYLTDAAGTVTDTFDFDAFGTLIAQNAISNLPTPNSYLYCGEQFDEDFGLYYNRARYLNTDSGRFWTRDTFEGTKYDPASLHKHLYAHADPINGIDPSGEMTLTEIMTALGIDGKVQKSVNLMARQAAKRISRKVGCEAAKAATAQGVYVLVLGNGSLYVGQSKDIARRFGEHLQDLEKAGARIVGMLKVTTGIENARAAKYLREIFEAALIQQMKPGANVIQNPVANPNRFLKYADPVQAGVDKLFEITPLCK